MIDDKSWYSAAMLWATTTNPDILDGKLKQTLLKVKKFSVQKAGAG